MPDFVALTSKGLVTALHDEMKTFDVKIKKVQSSSIVFETNWSHLRVVAERTRVATRILKTVLEFPAYKPEDVYHNIQKHDFTKYIDPSQAFSVEVRGLSRIFTNLLYVSQKIKDAVADQFREKFDDERPDFDPHRSSLLVFVRVQEEKFIVSVDVCGRSLSQHGYRQDALEAPLREHLAAGLIHYTGWNGEIPLLDPMCGSGTLIIEAALQMRGFNRREEFSFLRWKNTRDAFKAASAHKSSGASAVDEAIPIAPAPEMSSSSSELRNLIFGRDIEGDAIGISRKNARRAGVDDLIHLSVCDILDLEPPVDKPGLIVMNPPYGKRLQDNSDAEFYHEISGVFKRRFKGWTVWMLSGDPEATKAFHLKASQKVPVWNGNLECRWLKYEMR